MPEKNLLIYRQHEHELFSAIGEAISKWARLEFALIMLAAWALKLDNKETAKSFSCFKTFALTADFTQGVCRSRLPHMTYLNSLFDLIRELSGDRNFIAHTSVTAHGEGHPNEMDWAEATPKIGPDILTYLRQDVPRREPMDLAEVREVSEDIQTALTELMAFTEFLGTAPAAWPEKYLSPIQPRRPRLSERRDSGGKKLKPPPKPS